MWFFAVKNIYSIYYRGIGLLTQLQKESFQDRMTNWKQMVFKGICLWLILFFCCFARSGSAPAGEILVGLGASAEEGQSAAPGGETSVTTEDGQPAAVSTPDPAAQPETAANTQTQPETAANIQTQPSDGKTGDRISGGRSFDDSANGGNSSEQGASQGDVSWAGGQSIAGGGIGVGSSESSGSSQSKFTPAPFTMDLTFDDKTETLTMEDTKEWRKISPAGQYVWNHDLVYAYLNTLKKKYDTPPGEVEFTTHKGRKHTFHSDNCGWHMNIDMTAEQLEACADQGETVMDPIWNSGCIYSSKNGVGPKYVEISIDEQKVFLWEWGELIFETDCVTGTKGYTDTHTGVYQVIYTASPSVLKDTDPNGYEYEQPVNYWIPFNGSEGMHDALWKSEFGGDIYTYDGSHGCVNLPLDAAERIFHEVYIYYPVVVYSEEEWREEGTYGEEDETEKPSSTKRKKQKSGEDGTESVSESSSEEPEENSEEKTAGSGMNSAEHATEQETSKLASDGGQET